uniref:ATP-dependent DNA helicase n=3 Tax=Clastoptera arizonana TaxID=38151 RepID=A0A1B6D7V2_9HEMI
MNNTDNTPPPRQDHIDILKKYFGHSQFRPMQWKIIYSIIEERRDNCVIMATGYGKSLCYQYPAVFCSGLAVVVSPLISLMQDQVLSLQVANIPACFLGSAQTAKSTVLNKILNGEYRVVYLTPEWCSTDFGKDILTRISKTLLLNLVAIDEAHCVSQWGFDFRTSYRKLGELRNLLSNVPFLCVTATATPRVRNDIIASLNLRNANITITSFDRPNLYLSVSLKGADIVNDLTKFMERIQNKLQFPGPTIIYCPTKKITEKVAFALNGIGVQTGIYHADILQKTRREVHEKFVKDLISVVVATIAFGMGIDKPDVRLVIHYGAPKDFEAYYQEVGRAGRDGLPSTCQVYYTPADFSISRHFLSSINGAFREHREKMVRLMELYLETKECRRKVLISHFDQKEANELKAKDNCCDNCTMKSQSHLFRRVNTPDVDIKPDAKILLKAVKVLDGRFGLGVPIALIRGKSHQKLKDFHQKLEVFGSGQDKAEAWWKAIGRLLVREGLLTEYSANFSGSTWGKKQFPMTLTRITNVGEKYLASVDDDNYIKLVPTPEILGLVKKNPVTTKPNEWHKVAGLSQAIEVSQTGEESHVSEEELEYQTKLYLRLLEMRSRIAVDNNCMPYMVANNKTLLELAKIRPSNSTELCRVEGFGDIKVQKFGSAILKTIESFYIQNKLGKSQIQVEELRTKFGKTAQNNKFKHSTQDTAREKQNVETQSGSVDLWGDEDDSFLEDIPMSDDMLHTSKVVLQKNSASVDWEDNVWHDDLEQELFDAEKKDLIPQTKENKSTTSYKDDSDTCSDLEQNSEHDKEFLNTNCESIVPSTLTASTHFKPKVNILQTNKRKTFCEDSDEDISKPVKTKLPQWLSKTDAKMEIKRRMKANSLFKM